MAPGRVDGHGNAAQRSPSQVETSSTTRRIKASATCRSYRAICSHRLIGVRSEISDAGELIVGASARSGADRDRNRHEHCSTRRTRRCRHHDQPAVRSTRCGALPIVSGLSWFRVSPPVVPVATGSTGALGMDPHDSAVAER